MTEMTPELLAEVGADLERHFPLRPMTPEEVAAADAYFEEWLARYCKQEEISADYFRAIAGPIPKAPF